MYNLRSTASRQATEMEPHTGGIRMEAFCTTKDADLWLKKFENFCKLKGWKDEQIVAAFPLYLSDSAVLWYDSLSQETQNTVTELKKTFLERFSITELGKWKTIEHFFNRKQTADESVEEYCEAVRRMASQLSKTENDIKDVIIRGFRPDIRRFVLGKEPKSLHDTVKYARTAQAIADCDNSPIAAIQEQLSALELKMDRHHALVNSATPQAWSRARDHSRERPPRDYSETRTREPVPYRRDHSADHHRETRTREPVHFRRDHSADYKPREPAHYRRDYNAENRSVTFAQTSRSDQRQGHREYADDRSTYAQSRNARTHPQTRQRCDYCGEYRHVSPNQCRARGRKCNNCGTLNHFARVCRAAKFSH